MEPVGSAGDRRRSSSPSWVLFEPADLNCVPSCFEDKSTFMNQNLLRNYCEQAPPIPITPNKQLTRFNSANQSGDFRSKLLLSSPRVQHKESTRKRLIPFRMQLTVRAKHRIVVHNGVSSCRPFINQNLQVHAFFMRDISS